MLHSMPFPLKVILALLLLCAAAFGLCIYPTTTLVIYGSLATAYAIKKHSDANSLLFYKNKYIEMQLQKDREQKDRERRHEAALATRKMFQVVERKVS
jgi:hypothetical protein